MPHDPPSATIEQVIALAIATAHAIGTLDGAVARSPVAAIWRERAAIVGLAGCLAVAGTSLTPAEFFRSAVGLNEPSFVQSLDRGLVSAVIETALPRLLPTGQSLRLLTKLGRTSGLIVGPDWADVDRPSTGLVAALAAALDAPRADIGTALHDLAGRLGIALELTRARLTTDAAWTGWMVAALMPAALAATGLVATPLPCLTGVSRSLRYATTSQAETRRMLFITLGDQARAGLALLRRLEACAVAWQERLHGVTRRSRAGVGAGLFLVWPALTRQQFALALKISPAGAAKLLEGLIARDIVAISRFGGRIFYVASESLGDFKLVPRQGRSPEAPALQPLFAAFDDALAAFDLLGFGSEISTPIV